MFTVKVQLLQYSPHISDEECGYYTHTQLERRGTHVSFWWRDAELDQTNLSFLDPSDPSGQVRSFLVQHQTFYQLSVLDCTTAARELELFVTLADKSSHLRFSILQYMRVHQAKLLRISTILGVNMLARTVEILCLLVGVKNVSKTQWYTQ